MVMVVSPGLIFLPGAKTRSAVPLPLLVSVA